MKTRLAGFFIFLLVLLAWVIAANSQPIPGTVVAAAMTTGDFANQFATAFTFEIQGTEKQVPDLAGRDAISADRRTEGMMCYVTGETNVYALVGGTNNANWMLWASPTNSGGGGVTLVQVNNFVETNLFQTIHVLTNFFDTVYVTNKLELEYLTPNTVLQADASRDIQSIVPNVLGMLTNSGPGGVFGWSQDASILTNINNLSQSLSNWIAGFTTNSSVLTNTGWTNDITGIHTTDTNKFVGIGISAPTHVLHIVTDTNNAVGIDSTGVSSDSMIHIMNLGVQGPFMDFHGANGRWAWGVSSLGYFGVRGYNPALDPVNSSTFMFFNTNGNAEFTGQLAAQGMSNLVFSTSGYVTNDDKGKFSTTPTIPNAGLANSSVTVNGTANEIDTSGATIALGGSATLSLPSVLIAPGTFAAVTGITNQSFAASGYVTNDANGKLYTTPTIPNAGLANNSVTVNGTANHVTTTSASIALGGSATLDTGTSVVLRDANNVWVNTSSNFNNNAVWTDATNANNTTPDFAIRTSTLSTNASFTWLLPTHLDGSGKVEQWIKTSVTNSSGSLITMTAPAGCHVCGAGANNVTNWTEILWQYYPPSGPTNYWPIPGY